MTLITCAKFTISTLLLMTFPVINRGCIFSGYIMGMGALEKHFCDVSDGQKTGTVEDPSLVEASGLVASRLVLIRNIIYVRYLTVKYRYLFIFTTL